MPKALRIEMMEVDGQQRRPDGYIYALNAAALEQKVEEAAKQNDRGVKSLPVGKPVEIEITAEFDEFLALGTGEAYWTLIGKHEGDLTLGKL